MTNIEMIQTLSKAKNKTKNKKRRLIAITNKTENTTLTPNENMVMILKNKPGFQKIFGNTNELATVKIKSEKLTLNQKENKQLEEEIDKEREKLEDIIDLLTDATFKKNELLERKMKLKSQKINKFNNFVIKIFTFCYYDWNKKIENKLNKNQNELYNAINDESMLLTKYNSNKQKLMQKINDFVESNSKTKKNSLNLSEINSIDNQNKNMDPVSNIKLICDKWQNLYPEYKARKNKLVKYLENMSNDNTEIPNKEANEKLQEAIREMDREIYHVLWDEYKKEKKITDNTCNETVYNEWCSKIMKEIYNSEPILKSKFFLINIIETSFKDIKRDEYFKKIINWKEDTNTIIKRNEEKTKECNETWSKKYKLKYYKNKTETLRIIGLKVTQS